MVEAQVTRQFWTRILLVGERHVGKTSLMNQFARSTFREGLFPTIGVDTLNKTIIAQDSTVRAQVWDISFRSTHVPPIYFRKASGALLVFSVTERDSLDYIDQWISLISTNSEEIPMILIGNMSDLENKRVISFDVAQRFANDRRLPYIETSAKTACNVQQAF